MGFIEQYYIWFIVGGVILIMTLIGYIADKTEFIEKSKNKDKMRKEELEKKKKGKKSKEQEVFEEEIGDGKNLILSEGDIDYPVTIEEENDEIPVVDDSFEKQLSEEAGLTFEGPIAMDTVTDSPIEDIRTIVEPDEDDVTSSLDVEDIENDGQETSSEDSEIKVEEPTEETPVSENMDTIVEPIQNDDMSMDTVQSMDDIPDELKVPIEDVPMHDDPATYINDSVEENEDLPASDSISEDLEPKEDDSIYKDTTEDDVWKF